MNTPRVSAIIPTYNAEQTIASAIDSALAQDFSDLEVVVVNDGSTDSTRSIIEGYGSRITMVNQENRGASGARNAGAQVARGEYFAFLDADDLWAVDKISRSCAALDRNANASLAYSDYRHVVADRELGCHTFGSAPSMNEMLSSICEILPSTVVIRRIVFEACGGFSEEFRRNYFEDCWFWIRVREYGEFEYIRAALTTYRSRVKHLDKDYLANGKTFLRLVDQHYGSRAKGLTRNIRQHLAWMAVHEALRRMDLGERRAALEWWMRALRSWPALIVDPRIVARVIRRRNFRRLLRTLALSRLLRNAWFLPPS
jgi:glycosyltransferase involved in cell wall biosynthesis